MWWLPEEEVPNNSSRALEEKVLGDRAKGHIMAGYCSPEKEKKKKSEEKILDQNLKLLIAYRILHVLNVLCI